MIGFGREDRRRRSSEGLRWTLASVVLVALSAFSPNPSGAAVWDGYPDGSDIERRLQAAATGSGGLTQLSELGRTATGETLWVARIGSGESRSPALLLVAGLDGRHLHGVELALRHVEALSADPDSTRALLAGGTLYVVPTLRPDALTLLRARPSRARATSPGVGDHDRDGLEDEDRADDLDGDGVLRWVRIADGGGDFRNEAERPEILHRADRGKGEVAAFRLLTEGRDDDGDRSWNEEEDGGVLLSQNFPQGYEWFTRNGGPHQVSEPETRALAEFLVLHPEIGILLVYGFEDNLLRPWPEQKSSDPPLDGARWGRRPVDAPNKQDLPFFRELSDRYLEAMGLDEAKGSLGYGGFVTEIHAEEEIPVPDAEGAARGGLAAFGYYHRGLVALSTPAWTPGAQLARLRKLEEEEKKRAKAGGSAEAPADSTAASPDSSSASDEKSELPEAIRDEARFLDWLRATDGDAWKDWAEIAHPDFPGRKAEVGGYAPLARIVPPIAALDELFAGHQAFLVQLLAARPRVDLRSLSLLRVDGEVYALEIEVSNEGYLPDVLAQGVYATLVHPTRFELTLPAGAEVLGGGSRGPLGRIPGSGGGVEARRILRIPGGGPVEVSIVSEHGGRVSRRIAPGESWRRP